MAKEQNQKALDYTPIREQRFKICGNHYIYDFAGLTYLQIALAEELALLKDDRIQYKSERPENDESVFDFEYRLNLAAILLVKVVDNKRLPFRREQRDETKEDIENMTNKADIERLERCMLDFFILRGKRTLGSGTLMRNGSNAQGLKKMMTFLKLFDAHKKNVPDFGTPMNTEGDAKSESETII